MKKNMGPGDRAIRLVVTMAILVLYLSDVITGTTALILGAIAAVFVLTSAVGVCPAYMPFGIKTCKAQKSGK